MPEPTSPDRGWRQGRHQTQNLYADGQYVGVIFAPHTAALVVETMNVAAERWPADEVVDAEIVGFEAQCATYERRVKAAIAVLEDDDLNLFRRHAIALEYLRSAL
jgi:hypothetical protein